jgi:hypothetical protein
VPSFVSSASYQK